MTPRLRTALMSAALAGALAAIYTIGLGRVPSYLHHDEIWLALNGYTIQSAGVDIHGARLPLYFPVFTAEWFQPVPVYWTAFVLKLAPLTETSARLPTVIVAALDVVLLFFVVRRLFGSEALALVAGAMLILTPAHFIHGRLAMDYVYPLPFVLAWLLCLLVFLERRRLPMLCAATLSLGLGFYSYIASVAMMPLYLAMTFVALWAAGVRRAAAYAIAAGGFLLPLAPLVLWLAHNPSAYAQSMQRYDLNHQISVLERASVYWDFFNPAYLFLSGGSNIMNSTREAGVFPLSLAIFLPVGLYRVLRDRLTAPNLLLLAGFVTAPAAALLVDERYAIDRELELLLFGVLLATIGAASLLRSPARLMRAGAIGLLVLMPLQFYRFCGDYFERYPQRSSRWFEGNVPAALEAILARAREQPPPAIILSEKIRWIDDKWRFYAVKHRREDLLERTRYSDPASLDLGSLTAGTLIMADAGRAEAALAAGGLQRIAVAAEPDGTPSFAVFVK